MIVTDILPYFTVLGNNGPKLTKLFKDNEELFNKAPGSRHNHQAWPGGFIQHICDTIEIASMIHNSAVISRWELPFNIINIATVLVLHDIEKPFMYQEIDRDPNAIGKWCKEYRRGFRGGLIDSYDIILTTEEKVALTFIEGEGDAYSPYLRVMNELGAICHAADVLSARLWHNRNKPE